MNRFAKGAVAAGAGLVLLLGGAGSLASWAATAQLQATASAADTGIAQTVHPGLAITYGNEDSTAAAAVSITNTGSREALYTLSLRAEWSSSTSLPTAISVAVAPVADAAACVRDAVLVGAVTGTLAQSDTDGVLPAGETAILCVQTSMSPVAMIAHPGAQVTIALQSALEYAPSCRIARASGSSSSGSGVIPSAR